jgi:hypothetical protein
VRTSVAVAATSRQNAEALRVGELLTEVRERLGHGKWLKWLGKNVSVSPRQAQRYVRLWEYSETLDRMFPSWRSEWSPSRVVDEFMYPSEDDEREETADLEPSEDTEDEEDAEGDEQQLEDEEEGGNAEGEEVAEALQLPRRTAKELREALADHQRRMDQLPEFLKAGPLKFGKNSIGLAALRELGTVLREAANRAAFRLYHEMRSRGGADAELISMALVTKLPELLPVAELFAPGPTGYRVTRPAS